MRYLVTGAAGFIGARFVERCKKDGIGVISVDTLANFSRPEHAGLDFGMKFDTEDIMHHLLHDAPSHIDAIVHLGAITDTTADDIHELRRLNTEFSHDLWNYAFEYQVPFVYASSAATYGASETFNDGEEELRNLIPLNNYGMSKHAFDLDVLKMERRGIRPPTWAGFKFFNVYGYGEAHKGRMASMVYQAFQQIKSDKTITLFRSHRDDIEDGMQCRDFIYVDDVIDVLRWSLGNVNRGIYNLGSGVANPFLELAFSAFEATRVFPHIEWINPPEDIISAFKSLKVFSKIEWVDTPEDIRDQYQYFTKAEMQKLRTAGYKKPFTSLKAGIKAYAKRLEL